jgi:hypothetical protein
MMNATLGLPPIVNLVLTIAFAIGLASAVTFIVERPANRKIRRVYRNYVISPASIASADREDRRRSVDISRNSPSSNSEECSKSVLANGGPWKNKETSHSVESKV